MPDGAGGCSFEPSSQAQLSNVVIDRVMYTINDGTPHPRLLLDGFPRPLKALGRDTVGQHGKPFPPAFLPAKALLAWLESVPNRSIEET